jgi:hypothetical protein
MLRMPAGKRLSRRRGRCNLVPSSLRGSLVGRGLKRVHHRDRTGPPNDCSPSALPRGGGAASAACRARGGSRLLRGLRSAPRARRDEPSGRPARATDIFPAGLPDEAVSRPELFRRRRTSTLAGAAAHADRWRTALGTTGVPGGRPRARRGRAPDRFHLPTSHSTHDGRLPPAALRLAACGFARAAPRAAAKRVTHRRASRASSVFRRTIIPRRSWRVPYLV